MALTVVLVGAFMAVLDVFIVNVALPAMREELRAGSAGLELVVAGYTLAYAVVLVTGARLGDRFGRGRVFVAGTALFTLASIACGVAPTIAVLVAARVVQGVGAALLFPQVLASIQALYPRAQRGRALGVYGAALGSASVAGQLGGGLLLAWDPAGLGWRAVFLVNVPVGAVLVLAAWRWLPDTRARRRPRLDLIGVALASLALVLLVGPLSIGAQAGWPLWCVLALAASVPAGAAFLAWQRRLLRRRGEPLVDLRLFTQSAFRVGVAVEFAFFSTQVAFFYVLALTLQDGMGASPLAAGLTFVPQGLAFLLVSLIADRFARRHGRRVLWVGAALLVAGFLGLLLVRADATGHLTALDLAPWMALCGAGSALVVTPLFTVVLSGVSGPAAGSAAGVLTTIQEVAIATSVAGIGLLYTATLPQGVLTAFHVALLAMIGLAAALAALVFLLPRATT